MTTLAYRNGVLAGDGRITQGDTVVSDKQRKVHRLRDGRLFGYAGDQEDAERLRTSLVKGTPPPPLENIRGLIINLDGSIDLYEGNVWQRLKDTYYAIGTGGALALVLMDANHDAVEAVKYAMKRDINSGGKVVTVRLKGR